MRSVAIILANSQFISAFFLKLKIHEAEMANFVTFLFIYCCSMKKIKKSKSTILLSI